MTVQHPKKISVNMKLIFSRGKFSKFAKISILFSVANLLFGCQPLYAAPASGTPPVELQIFTPSLLTETPIPPCVSIPDVKLSVVLLSENSVHIKITGLMSKEAVQAIYGSTINGQKREITVSGTTDEKGIFEDSRGLRGQEIDSEHKDWQIRVVHSRGSACTEISLPEN